MKQAPRSEDIECGRDWPVTVQVHGRDNAASPVIMLHGLESHSAWFVRSAGYIASLGFPVYAMERRGSGDSQAPRGWCGDFHDLVEDINALVDYVSSERGHDKIHLLGHCFGAIPATAYACSHPGRIRSLVLATPALYTRATPPLADKLKVLWAGISGSRLNIPVPLKADWFTDTSEHLEYIRNDTNALHEASARIYWEAAMARRFIHSHEQQLDMPVFMALAAQDRICDNPRNRALFDRLPAENKRCEEYPGAIHILEFSPEKDAFFADLRRWFSIAEAGYEGPHDS